MSKHTPGRWTIAHGKIVGNGYNIASINGSATSEGKANAALMAAAPELLESLQGFIDGAEAMGWNTDKARAAIAKATGQ